MNGDTKLKISLLMSVLFLVASILNVMLIYQDLKHRNG